MVNQWQEYQTGLFACALPPGWTFERADALRDPGMILMRDAEHSIALVFTTRPQSKKGAAATPPTEDAKQQLDRWVQRLAHVHLRALPHPIPAQGQVICTTEGLERLQAGVSWWKRLLRLGPRMLWRFWAIVNPEVLVLASCNGRPEAIERHRETVNKIIQSIHVPDRAEAAPPPPPPPPAPAATSATAAAEPLRWSDIRTQVFPLLVPMAQVAAHGPDVIEQPWVNELSILYVVAEPHHTLTQGECAQWHIDLETLHEQALHNLVGRSQELTMEGGRAPGYTMLAFAQPDPYNAMRILLPDLQRKLRQHLGNTFYVAIPNSAFLLAFATDQEDILSRVRQQIRLDFKRMASPISPKLFIMTSDGVAGEE